MREIRFRAWHKNRKTFLDFYWAVDKFGRTLSILDKCVYDDFTDEVELMQYTGLKDINGREIYEGDVVEFYHNDSIVKSGVSYSEGEFIVRKYDWESILLSDHDVKVIGNEFQNPELLEVAE